MQLTTNRKSYDAYRMAPIRVTFSDLEGHVCGLKPLCPSVTVVCFHDGALAGYCAVSSTTLVAVNVGWSQLRSSWHQQDWLYGSLLMTRMSLHARCAIVVPTATMRIQNYAGSGIKRGSCW